MNDELTQMIGRHGVPVRVQVGVIFDEDGWQATALWHLKDGAKVQQFLMPSASEAEAERASTTWAIVIRQVFDGVIDAYQ